MSIDFIMDGATDIKQQSDDNYDITVYPSPDIKEDALRVDDYITAWPCNPGRISIKV